MKNSKFFSNIHNIIIFSGFITIWSSEGWKGKMMKFYSTFIRITAIIQMALIDLHIKNIGTMEDWKEVTFFITTVLTTNITLYKMFLFDGSTIKNLIKEAIIHDNLVQEANNKMKRELEDHGNNCWVLLSFYTISFFCIYFSFLSGTLILYLKSLNCNPELEKCRKAFAWPSASLLNMETHYGMSLIFNTIGISVFGVFVLVSNVTLASLCIFPTFKLKDLQHKLKNFQYYGKVLGETHNISTTDAEYFVIRECIIMHQKVISDFEELKKFTNFLFLVDFITHAMQTAPYLIIVLASDGTIDYAFTMTLSCMIFLVIELFMNYWFAQGVIDESINVGTSVTESNWYEADVKTMKLMQLLMIRSNRRLALRVGPFYDMELNIFLKICKMMYTVVTVFRKNL